MRPHETASAVALALILTTTVPGGAQEDDWIARSNAHAQVLLEVMARFAPESAGQLGVDGLDEEIFQLPADINERTITALEGALSELERRLAVESSEAVRQDLEILIDAAEQNIRGTRLSADLQLPYFNVPQAVFQGLRALLDERIPEERRAAALVRLRKYTGLEPGYTPITQQAMTYMRSSFDTPGLQGPFVDNLDKDLANAPRFVAGIEQLFQQFGLAGWEEPYATLRRQLEDYETFLREELRPRASETYRLPAELYAFGLEGVGIDMPVAELQSRAKTSFREIQNEMQALATMIAAERGLDMSDYRDVIRHLKKDQIYGEAIKPLYEERIASLEKLIAEHDVVTLPERPMQFRFASEAETAAIPAPHVDPPRLLGNTGELGAFVLPLVIPDAEGKEELAFDDFTFDAAAWTLTVHEGRPGHELQFASIIEKGVSTARTLFAFNSVNVEGWALYAEAEMKPYLPLEGQLISLQHRLMRAARAFLDPGIQLGLLTQDEAFAVLERDVVLSRAMALQEVERYSFWAPGQAGSYFCGYSRLMELRTDVERLLGDAFDRREYHDFVLAQGLLPPALLRQAVIEGYVKPKLVTIEAEGTKG
jgi:hypothetical protein